MPMYGRNNSQADLMTPPPAMVTAGGDRAYHFDRFALSGVWL